MSRLFSGQWQEVFVLSAGSQDKDGFRAVKLIFLLPKNETKRGVLS